MSRKLKQGSQKRKKVNIVEFYSAEGSIFLFLDDDGKEVMPGEIVMDDRWIPKSEILKN